ncbi:hypothetical protein AHF37_03142, partial [Paragonimus kellicotti]
MDVGNCTISILRQQPPGSFLIRDSTTFKGAFGLAVKVATLPPKVTPKSDDLQSELVRHYLIEVVNSPTRGVRLKGFASEPVFPSLAALIHQHTIDPLALPCRLTLPSITTNIPSSGTAALPPLVIGTEKRTRSSITSEVNNFDNATVASSASVLGASPSEVGSTHTDGMMTAHRVEMGQMAPNQLNEAQMASQNVPFVCVLRESPTHGHKSPLDTNLTQGVTFRCLMLGSVDTPQWNNEVCFARAVDQLIPLTQLTASECDHGLSRVRYTEVQLHVNDLQSELVRHYLIEVVNSPTRGVRLKGFASEPVFPSLAALIHQHTIDPLALPCRLTLPSITTNIPSSGTAALPPLVIGTEKRTRSSITSEVNNFDNATVASSASVLGASPSEVGSTHTDGMMTAHRVEMGQMAPNQLNEAQMASQNVPFVCVLRESPTHGHKSPLDTNLTQGVTFRCLMLGSVDTPQWNNEVCFARAVDQLIPLTQLTASECDHGLSRVRYTEVQLHVSAHDGITII